MLGLKWKVIGEWFKVILFVTVYIWWYGIIVVSNTRTSPTSTQPTRKYTQKKNVMKSLNKPIILVEAKSTGNSSRASNSVMRLLSDIFFLCINVRVIMTSNILKN